MVIDPSEEAYQDYNDRLPFTHQQVLLELTTSIIKEFPTLERVIAWEIPYFRTGNRFVLGIELYKDTVWIHPFQESVLAGFTNRIAGYKPSPSSFELPLDEPLNEILVHDIITACLEEIAS